MAYDGQEIAGYKILRKIGEGGMGQVFLAEQLRLHRQVAIKLVHLDVKPETPTNSTVEPAAELTREAQALMALEHPNILPLYDTGRDGDMAYLVMPYLPEGSLQDALRSGPLQQLQLPLPPGEALIYIEQATAALQYAHDRNFIHRDVKPANFLVRSLSQTTRSERTVKRLHLFLADFGLSKFLAYATNTRNVSGTPTFMAPEQFQGRAGPASDQYSLAVLFFYLLTGDLPFRGSPIELMFHHLNDLPPAPSSRVPSLPPTLDRVIQRGMAKQAETRFPSVVGLAEAAREALAAAGMLALQDSAVAIPAVRLPDLQSQTPSQQPSVTPQLGPAALASLETVRSDPPAQAPPSSPGGSAGPKPRESVLPTVISHGDAVPARSVGRDSSLPTLPSLGDVNKPPTAEKPAEEGRRRGRGGMIALIALVVVVLLGAVGGGGYIFLSGQHKATATATPTPTATHAAPTPIPASALLNSILAQSPSYQVDLTQGSSQWDGPFPINRNAFYQIRTPGDAVIFQNATISLNARTFQAPLAIAIDLKASGDQQFAIDLAPTITGGTHYYYRLQLPSGSAPQAAHSGDNSTFTLDGTGTGNPAWNDGATHTLILVLDKTRLLFYFDQQPLLDTQIPLPDTPFKLNLASSNQATVTSIKFYNVPQGG